MQSSPVLPDALKIRDRSAIFPPALPKHYSFLVRPPLQHRINIKHPGYDKEDDNLLTLYAWDDATGGLHYDFVLDVCNIIAGNRPGGYLSTTRGRQPIEAGTDALLRAGSYYFHIPAPATADNGTSFSNIPYRWPVVACFRDWQFPENIPSRWTKDYFIDNVPFTSQHSTFTSAVRGRDRTCRISDHFTGTEVVHLVPQHESEWFHQNSMSVYNIDLALDSDNLLNDLGNFVLLRSDLHTAFDDRKFVFYPKSETSFVIHMLEPIPDLVQLYHNVEVQAPFNCHPNFLYAHLAWAIFPSLAGFWRKPGVKRAALMCKDTDNGRELVEQEIMNTPDFQAKITSSRSRSPKKRQRARDDSDETPALNSKQSQLSARNDRIGDDESVAARKTSGNQTLQRDEDSNACSALIQVQTFPPTETDDDQQILRRFSQQALQLCPSWYPGHKKIDEMKNNWLSRERQKSGISVT